MIHVGQTGLKLSKRGLELLPPPPKCWDYRHTCDAFELSHKNPQPGCNHILRSPPLQEAALQGFELVQSLLVVQQGSLKQWEIPVMASSSSSSSSCGLVPSIKTETRCFPTGLPAYPTTTNHHHHKTNKMQDCHNVARTGSTDTTIQWHRYIQTGWQAAAGAGRGRRQQHHVPRSPFRPWPCGQDSGSVCW